MKRPTKKIVASKKRNLRGRSLMATKGTMKSRRYVKAGREIDSIRDELMELLDSMRDQDIVYIWNEYCRETGDDISEIYSMDDFDELCEGMSPSDIARSIFYGCGAFEEEEFNPNYKFVGFTGNGNFASFDYLSADTARYYPEDLVDYIIRNDEDFGESDIRDILDGDDDEDFDEE